MGGGGAGTQVPGRVREAAESARAGVADKANLRTRRGKDGVIDWDAATRGWQAKAAQKAGVDPASLYRQVSRLQRNGGAPRDAGPELTLDEITPRRDRRCSHGDAGGVGRHLRAADAGLRPAVPGHWRAWLVIMGQLRKFRAGPLVLLSRHGASSLAAELRCGP